MSGFKIEVPQNYFARIAAKEYSDDAGMAVIREFAQNSTDAGATQVGFLFSETHLTVVDNGKGCSAETVRTKLLTPLGTLKEAEAIGGFGKAKELLFFANPSWVIRTRDVQVTGSFLTVEDFQTGLTFFEGFQAVIQLPPALHTAAVRASRDFLRRSERPNVNWYLNYGRVDCEVIRSKRAAKDFGFAKAYVDSSCDDSTIYLRTGGLLTATRWGYHGPTVGRVVIEVTGASSELLTPARDWFRASSHRQQVEGWLNQLVTNAKQTLADEVGDEIKFADLEEVPELTPEQEALISARDVVPKNNGMATKMDFAQIPITMEGLATGEVSAFLRAVDPHGALNASEECEGRLPEGSQVERSGVVTRPARRRADGFDMLLMPVVLGALRLVVHTGGKAQAKVGARWLKKNQDAARRTLAAWATAVRVVAQRNGLPLDAVGFTFRADARAEFVKSGKRFALLINPLTIDLDSSDAADELLDCALHETAHLVHGDSHSEAFVYGEGNLRRKVRGSTVRGTVARALRSSEVQSVEEVS